MHRRRMQSEIARLARALLLRTGVGLVSSPAEAIGGGGVLLLLLRVPRALRAHVVDGGRDAAPLAARVREGLRADVVVRPPWPSAIAGRARGVCRRAGCVRRGADPAAAPPTASASGAPAPSAAAATPRPMTPVLRAASSRFRRCRI